MLCQDYHEDHQAQGDVEECHGDGKARGGASLRPLPVKPRPAGADHIRVGRVRASLALSVLAVAVFVPGASAGSLLTAGRSLIPADRSFLVRGPIVEHDCFVGHGQTARCVQFNIESIGLSYTARKRLLLMNASRQGWKLLRKREYRNSSAFIYLSRGDLRATLGVGPTAAGSGRRVPTWVQVTRPATRKSALPPPVAVHSHATGPAKRRFVDAANAACRSALERVKRIPHNTPKAAAKKYREELDRTISRQTPPRGDEQAVRQVLAEFRRFSRAIGYLITVKGENSLGAVAEIAVSSKRARTAAKAYKLTACLPLLG
jgi:hypothetical protein